MTKEEFIETYLDDSRLLEIMEKLDEKADLIEYDRLISIINDCYSGVLDYYVEDDKFNFRDFNEDVITAINAKINEI